MFKSRKGFTPAELAIVVGIGALVAATLIFTVTAPPQMAQMPDINVNITTDGGRTPSALAAKSSKTFVLESTIGNLTDATSPLVFQQFLDDLELATELDVEFGGQGSNVLNRVISGDLIFGTGLSAQSGIGAMALTWGMPFGFEPQELISWLYDGGGLELIRGIYASRGVVPVPLRINGAEAGGWFREQITEGYINSGHMRMRLYGIGAEIVKRVYPAAIFPPVVAGFSALGQFECANDPECPGYEDSFTDLEFSFPTTDKQQFFDNPGAGNTIIDAGAKHYYISGWWQPSTNIELWINKDFYDSLSQDTKDGIDLASRANLTRALSAANRQGAAVKYFQDYAKNAGLPFTVWDSWPEDILRKLKRASIEMLSEKAAADPEFAAVLSSMKNFAKTNQTRWSESNVDRVDRFSGMEGGGWDGWESIITTR